MIWLTATRALHARVRGDDGTCQLSHHLRGTEHALRAKLAAVCDDGAAVTTLLSFLTLTQSIGATRVLWVAFDGTVLQARRVHAAFPLRLPR